MNILVKYLKSEVVKANDSYLEVKSNSDTYVEAKLIHIDRDSDGSVYGYIVLTDGTIKRVLTSLLKVIDKDVVNFTTLGPVEDLPDANIGSSNDLSSWWDSINLWSLKLR